MNPKSRHALFGAFITLLFSSLLSGCHMLGLGTTTIGVGALHEELERERFRAKLDNEAQEYLRDHANSPCTNDEDKVMPYLLDYIEAKGRRNGVDKAIKHLNAIYEETANSDDVRAAALYHIAVLYLRRPDNNPYLGVDYLKRIHDEFPGKYDCIFADTPWRQEMIKKLGIPADAIPQQG